MRTNLPFWFSVAMAALRCRRVVNKFDQLQRLAYDQRYLRYEALGKMNNDLPTKLAAFPRIGLTLVPTPLEPLKRLTAFLGGPEIWIKRDDCTALGGGGNKLRKLEYLVADAIAQGADTLITVGGIQSNHTRQTAAAAAKAGLKCILLHLQWVDWPTPHYDQVGNFLFGKMLGADVRVANIGPDESLLASEHLIEEIAAEIRAQGRVPYIVPSGASDHPLGGLGYVDCAVELIEQQKSLGLTFDYLVHATSSGSTQAGLITGFHTLNWPTVVIGVDVNNDVPWMQNVVAKLPVRPTD